MDNKPLSVDNTINGHAGYPSVATPPVPTTRIGKKRPTIHANSNADRHRRASDLLVVLMLIVAQSQGACQWTSRDKGNVVREDGQKRSIRCAFTHLLPYYSVWDQVCKYLLLSLAVNGTCSYIVVSTTSAKYVRKYRNERNIWKKKEEKKRFETTM